MRAVSAEMPPLIALKATMPLKFDANDHDSLTCISVFVTGVLIRKPGKGKLKTTKEDPRGAAYSACMYSRARALPIKCESFKAPIQYLINSCR